jgi:hypothetical protein
MNPQTDLRIKALELAAQDTKRGEFPRYVIARAEAYLEFLAPTPTPSSSTYVIDARKPHALKSQVLICATGCACPTVVTSP